MREADIRPQDLLDEYLRLSAEDAALYFPDPAALPARPCPGCNEDRPAPAFEKLGFSYVRCGNCDTLYANPCPDNASLSGFYEDSESSAYWATTFFPAVAESRRTAIFKPRAADVADLVRGLGISLQVATDVGAGHGYFLDELAALTPDLSGMAVEPNVGMAEACQAKGYKVFKGFSWQAADSSDFAGAADLVSCFEVIEHVPDIEGLLKSMGALARPGGAVLLTGLSGDGFDIRLLGARSKAVSPPHHLNFLSKQGVEQVVKQAGLELEMFFTPGKLDVDIVRNALNDDPGAVVDPFLCDLINDPDPAVGENLQQFLTENCRSSHMWILARRPG